MKVMIPPFLRLREEGGEGEEGEEGEMGRK
jgi:hypothetical protein